MRIIDCGVTRTNMYGHYNYYIAYEYKNGKYSVFVKTNTDSEMYDRLSEVTSKQYEKTCKSIARSGNNVHEFTSDDDYKRFMRKRLTTAFV